MATFLDLGLLQYFNVIFPVILIWALLFAILQKTKILGENMSLNAVVSMAGALMALLSPTIIQLINFVVPWFVVAFIFLILLLLLYRVLGASEKDVTSMIMGDKTIKWGILAVAVLILAAGFGQVLGQSIGPYLGGEPVDGEVIVTEGGTPSVATSDFQQNIMAIIFHPKVVGLVVLFGVAIFAVILLSSGLLKW
ncbi:hypothetical protein HOC13_00750 [Candidatus Woesearchaeota archaeon]|jgi:hypothetical protein|nr:hypothetical protein [Candidatus Woesearchaeota archaeon]